MKVKVPKEKPAQDNSFEASAAEFMAMQDARADREKKQSSKPAGGSGHGASGGDSASGNQNVPPGKEIWNWGKVDKNEAAKMLKGKDDGVFLVRESTSEPGSWSISVQCEGQCRHVKIVSVNGGYAINKKEKSYPTVAELITAKLGEKMTHKLHGAGQQKNESQLLVTPLKNPRNFKYQKKASSAASTPTASPAGGVRAPPPTGSAGKGVSPYARQRGGARQVRRLSVHCICH